MRPFTKKYIIANDGGTHGRTYGVTRPDGIAIVWFYDGVGRCWYVAPSIGGTYVPGSGVSVAKKDVADTVAKFWAEGDEIVEQARDALAEYVKTAPGDQVITALAFVDALGDSTIASGLSANAPLLWQFISEGPRMRFVARLNLAGAQK